jgi:phage terminase small subunit
MGSRGPLGSPFGRRAKSKNKKPFPAEATIPRASKPDIVKARPHASAYWDRHQREMHRTGRLNSAFEFGFAAVCLLWADVLECEEEIQREGMWLTDAKGRKYINPSSMIQIRAFRDYLVWAKQYALTPEAAKRVNLHPPEKSNNTVWDMF